MFTADQYETLLNDAVAEILSHEDPDRFLDWMRTHAQRLFGHMPFDDEGGPRAMAVSLGRALWNVTPLPGHQFRPVPLPAPGRNDPCACGSGRKFKHCCANLPSLTPFGTDDLWTIVVAQLDRTKLAAAIADRRIPASALASAAERLLDEGTPLKAAKLLEPLFESDIERLNERHEFAFDLLCDIYLQLGYDKKRVVLSERVATLGRKAMARAGWSRLATIRTDVGDHAGAWDAFRQAQRAEPGHPALALLETTLLLGEGRFDEASERARFWIAQLSAGPWDAQELIEKLREVVADPAGAFTPNLQSAAGADTEQLAPWAKSFASRALPAYRAAPPTAVAVDDPEALRARLQQQLAAMGADVAQSASVIDQMVAQLQAAASTAPDALPGPPLGSETAAELIGPASLQALEESWHALFPMGKPIGVHGDVGDRHDPWAPEHAARWQRFLFDNPAAADSVDILEDVANALVLASDGMLEGMTDPTLEAILQRAVAIVEAAVAGSAVTLPWFMAGNRAGLRLYVRHMFNRMDRNLPHESIAAQVRLLQLNPEDDHGIRSMLVQDLLHQNDNAEALAWIARYPDDADLGMVWGELLALLRTGRESEANKKLKAALKLNAHVPEYLLAKKPKAPKSSPHGLVPGSRDEAWNYYAEGRELWHADAKAMAWLAASTKKAGR